MPIFHIPDESLEISPSRLSADVVVAATLDMSRIIPSVVTELLLMSKCHFSPMNSLN